MRSTLNFWLFILRRRQTACKGIDLKGITSHNQGNNKALWSFIYGKISFEKSHPITRLAGMILFKTSFAQREIFLKNKPFKSKILAPILFLPPLPLSLFFSFL